MLRSLLITAMAALVAVSLGFADQASSKTVIPVNKTAATNGHEMYSNYCAPCHGTDGRGHGPAAAALKSQPTDLTVLSRNNHGKFPDTHIVAVLQFGSETTAHGSAQMPVWGPILGNMNRANIQEKQLRISNLSRYLETIQDR
jgi:mono/diheme cytochrome c family protein